MQIVRQVAHFPEILAASAVGMNDAIRESKKGARKGTVGNRASGRAICRLHDARGCRVLGTNNDAESSHRAPYASAARGRLSRPASRVDSDARVSEDGGRDVIELAAEAAAIDFKSLRFLLVDDDRDQRY